MKGELDALLPAGFPAWCLHDLRRSAASGMASLGVRIETVEKILNHAGGSFKGNRFGLPKIRLCRREARGFDEMGGARGRASGQSC
jgi:hypothetical protein